MMSASERINLTGIGKPLLDIRNKYATKAFSSDGVRYCWRFTFSYLEGRPCARYHRVVVGTLLDSDRAAYVLGFEGSRPSDRTALAGSILRW
jgi:hypothetical protein